MESETLIQSLVDFNQPGLVPIHNAKPREMLFVDNDSSQTRPQMVTGQFTRARIRRFSLFIHRAPVRLK
jgi:hypothetical protein